MSMDKITNPFNIGHWLGDMEADYIYTLGKAGERFFKEIKDNDNSSGVNNVDIEKEMMNLAEGQLMYEYGAKKLARTFGLLRAAIRGRSQ